ncbi:hypothetical protein [Chelatococcus sp. XZ-Ab1]|uniref:hypothetical protein n=1 Tax=Chelatococcus sp. XZ-Ab1 TaxID=3034027 RepID=UPI0023E40D2B|nr:hypothetical protein [Chelatococcus sp. XZ-Ab1]
MGGRTIIWWSTGAASFVVAQIVLSENKEAIIARCETSNEDPDNYRFEADAMRHLNRQPTILRSERYGSVWDVWHKRRYMNGIDGAPCTVEMKVAPRLAFQRPDDIHVFGYTCDARDVERFERLKENYPELTVRAPLIERGLTKASTLAMVERAGLVPPRSYAMGYPNANCLQTGCVKASSPNYWARYRQDFPDNFARTAGFAREIGARLARINGERVFIDDIPADWPTTDPIAPHCDFLCVLAEKDMEDAA